MMIGASDIGKIRGSNPWAGPHDVWITKAPVREALELGANEDRQSIVQQRGTDAEPLIREYAASRLASRGWTVAVPFKEIYMHPTIDVIGASWDAEILRDGELVGPLEIKSLGPFAHKWNGKVPAHIWHQVQQQMSTRPESSLAIVAAVRSDERTWKAIIDGVLTMEVALEYGMAQFEMHEVEKDEAFEEDIAPALKEWWDTYVSTATPPPADATDGCSSALLAAYPQRVGELSMSTDMLELLRDREALRAQIKSLEADKKLYDNKIRETLGVSKSMRGDGGSVSISTQSTSRLDSAAIRENEPAVYEKYLRSSQFDRLTVRLK